jgi:DNA-binding response OmpR family regulator
MKKYNVLVVNQDFKSLHTIFDYLEDEGKYNVMNATNAQMVQRIIRKKSLDVVLLDWETSIASELEVYHYLQQQESTREVPIVISTHPARTQTINEIITTDISAFVPKPIERVVLSKCITQAIAGHREAKAKKAAEENALATARQKMLEEEKRIAQEKAQIESKKNAVIQEQRRLKKELEQEKERLSATKAQLETQKEQIDHNQNSIEATKGKIEETQEGLQEKARELQQAQENLLQEKEALLNEKQAFAEAKAALFQEKEEALEAAQQQQQQLEEEKTALQRERERLTDEQAHIHAAQERVQAQAKALEASHVKLAQEEALLKTASKELQEAQKSAIKREVASEPAVLPNAETKHTREQTEEEKDAEMVMNHLQDMVSNPPTLNPDALQMEREQLEQARQQLLKAKERFEQEREEFLTNRDELLMEATQAREKGKDLAHLQKSVLATKAQLSKLEDELTHKQASLKLIEMEEKVAQRTNSAIPAKIQESLQTVSTNDSSLSVQGESFSKLLEKEAARLHTSSLMQYILPEEIARDLDEADYVHVNYHPSVSILYIGFEDLMSAVLKTDRSQLINELEVFFKAINDRVQQYGLERVRTKNNMYACAHRTLGTGDPIPLLKASLDIRQMALNYQAESDEVNQLIKKMYLGINTTDVVAGDTMHKRFAYDIWSDIIQTTHHLKKNLDIPIHLLQNTYRLVQDQVSCEHVGKIRTNRRGDWQVYELVDVLG